MTPRTPLPRKSTGGWGPGRSRFERDARGIREIPADAYWGIQTLRALEDCPTACTPISSQPGLVTALAQIKRAAALADASNGLVDEEKTRALVQAAREVEQGRLLDQFVVDALHAGAASTNANANEVLANRALEILGHDRGAYCVIPPDDLDTGQPGEDVYATAVRLAAIGRAQELLSALADLREGLATTALETDEQRILEALLPLHSIGPGTTRTAGRAADPHYAAAYLAHLQRITGLPLKAADPGETATGRGALVRLSAALTQAAAGVPSIVSGLVGPALADVVDQVAFDVRGNDLTIRLAAEAGRPAALEPVIAQALARSLSRLTSVCTTLAEQRFSPALEALPLLTRN